MDLTLASDLVDLGAEARAAGREWSARADQPEDQWLIGRDAEVSRALAARGWLGMTWPVEAGGGGRSVLERFVVFEALISEGAPIAASWFADRQIGPTLLQFGTAEQQRTWLPGIVDGTSMWAVGLSEPDAGSDVASVRTTAVRHGEDFVVNGQKTWNSGAARADFIYLVARTDPDAPPHGGLSELVVDLASPGITIVPIVDMTGNDHFCEVYFDEVRVPAEHLVGTENGSFKQVMRQMEHERGGIDRLVSNHRLYRDVLPLADRSDAVVRQEVAALESAYRLGRLLVLREVLGQAPRGFSAATKTFCTEHEQRVAAFCGRVLGPATLAWDDAGEPAAGSGITADVASRVARNLAYAPAYTLMGGTTQILRNIIGERVLGLPR